MTLSVTFYDEYPLPLRFRQADIRSIVVGGLAVRHKLSATFTGMVAASNEELRQHYEEQVDETPLWAAVHSLHKYVHEGAFPAGDRDVLNEQFQMVLAFALEILPVVEVMGENLGQAQAEDEGRYKNLISGGRALEVLLCTAYARWKLDIPALDSGIDVFRVFNDCFSGSQVELLSLTEIALLADIQERSVRNYTHRTRKEGERLITVKVGGRTFVTREDAAAWLRGRRRYIPTTDVPAPRGLAL